MSKLKPQYYTTTHLLEWLKLKKDYSKCYKDMEEMDSPNVAGMNAAPFDYFRKQFSGFLER